jgi:hypothetical protein
MQIALFKIHFPDSSRSNCFLHFFKSIAISANWGEGGLKIFDDFGGDDVGIGEITSVFQAFVFEPEPSRRETSEIDGQVERPPERARRSQPVEISVESPAVAAASVTGCA